MCFNCTGVAADRKLTIQAISPRQLALGNETRMLSPTNERQVLSPGTGTATAKATAKATGKATATSAQQRQANRRNALKSTGPKSLAGKRRASSNARLHGLSGAGELSTRDPLLGQLSSLIAQDRLDPVRAHPSSTPNPVFPGFRPLDPNKIKHLAPLFEFFCSGNIVGF